MSEIIVKDIRGLAMGCSHYIVEVFSRNEILDSHFL